MKVETENRTFDFEQLAARALDGSNYDQGQLENIQGSIRKHAQVIGRLIEFLVVEKKLMNEEDVRAVLGMYGKVKFIEE